MTGLLVKNVCVIPGISDHDGMLVVDTDVRPLYNKPIDPEKLKAHSQTNSMYSINQSKKLL